MKKIMGYGLLLSVFLLSGCASRVTPYYVDRTDQEIKGNRGILKGSAEASSEVSAKKTRKMYRLEIELPPKDGQGASVETKTTKGNKGYLTGSKTTKEKAEYMTKKSNGRVILEPMKPRVIYQEVASPVSSPAKKDKAVEKSTRTYVVQKGDTLQKISDKVYGTTKNWKKIFNANKKTLKDPNKIKLGQKLIIPEL